MFTTTAINIDDFNMFSSLYLAMYCREGSY